MMKVVHIITRLDMGGSAQNTLKTCHGLAHNYQKVLVIGATRESKMTDAESALVNEKVDMAKSAGVKIVILPTLLRKISPVNDLKSLLAMIRILKKERPDIVHTHTSKAGLLGRLAARMCLVPFVIHTPHGHVFYGHFKTVTTRIFLTIEKLMDKLTNTTIALTHGEAQDYIRLGVTVKSKLRVIHSGVDTDGFRPDSVARSRIRSEWGFGNNVVLVGTIGWLTGVKGSDLLLKAMATVFQHNPEALLVYVGKGELKEELVEAAKDFSVFDRIVFAGWRPDVPAVIQAIDIFVLPSRNEGMGRVLVEAMASSKPVVATRTGGIPDLIADGKNGLLVAPEDEKELAEAILYLLNNPEDAKKMGAAGKGRCQLFGTASMLNQLDKLYQEFQN